MLCPECENPVELKENISLKKGILKRFKVFTYFCPLCDFERVKEISISVDEYETILIERGNIKRFVSNKKISTARK